MKYPWAVIDGNHPPDCASWPWSVHKSYAAAEKEAQKQNKTSPNEHYYVLEWDAERDSKLYPNNAHYPCARWIRAQQEGL